MIVTNKLIQDIVEKRKNYEKYLINQSLNGIYCGPSDLGG
jgi:hypothetical protein